MENPTSEYVMSHKDLEAILQFTYCIKCGLCTSSCPTVAHRHALPRAAGARPGLQVRHGREGRGRKERFKLLDTEHGVFRCHYAGSCSAVCPKGVDPALGIQLLKRHVMSAKPPRRKGEGAKFWTQPAKE